MCSNHSDSDGPNSIADGSLASIFRIHDVLA
jgi:hypothetical protein